MLKIRLSRTGKKSQPSFKVVVQEHTAPIKGKFIEELGFYRPAEDPKVFKIDMERVKYWISVGATPSDAMAVLLKNEGLEGMDKFIAPRDKQRKKKKEEAPVEKPAEKPAEAPAEAPTEAPAEKPAEASAEAPAEKPAEAPAEPTAEPESKPKPEPAAEPEPKPEETPKEEQKPE